MSEVETFTTLRNSGPHTHGYVDTADSPSAVRAARGSLSRGPASLVALVTLIIGTLLSGVRALRRASLIDAEDARMLAFVCVAAALFVLLCVTIGYGIGAGISAYRLGLGAF